MSNNNHHNELHVIFGRGPVGLSIMGELIKRGKRVRIINRSGAPHPEIPDGVEIARGDAADPESTYALTKDASHVYNATNPPYTQWPELFPGLQAGVLAGAAAAGAKLIVMENVYMYGHTHGKPLTEDLPYVANTRKGRVRAQMADELIAAHRSGKVRVVMGRASDFFGPRVLESAMGERMIYPLFKGKAAQMSGNPDKLHTYTYMPDIGKALVTLGERDEALGQAWHIPTSQTVTTRQFVEMLAEEIGATPKIQSLPKLAIKGLALFMPIMREVDEMLYEFEDDFCVDHTKYVRAFGDHSTPLRDAIRETVKWYRENPQE